MSKSSTARKERKAKAKALKKNRKKLENMTISIAMMVKNEEKHLRRCLSSVIDHFDEIRVVDTGSTDATLEILKEFEEEYANFGFDELKDIVEDPDAYFVDTEYGKKFDFSMGRNLSISRCTGDWIFILDADEKVIFNQSEIDDVKRFIATECYNGKARYDAVAFPLYDIHGGGSAIQMQFNTVRIFKKGSVRYEGRVHNRPIIGTDSVFCPELYIFHYGYDMSDEERKAKEERTVGLLEADLREDPKNTRAMYFLLQSYAWHKRYEEAIEVGLKYVGLKNEPGYFDGRKDKFNKGCYYPLIRLLIRKGAEEKNADAFKMVRELIDEANKELPGNLDILQSMVEYGATVGDASYIQAGARGYMTQYEKFDAISEGENFVHTYSPDAYVFCAYHLARYQLRESALLLQRIKPMLGACVPAYAKNIANNINQDLEEVFKCK